MYLYVCVHGCVICLLAHERMHLHVHIEAGGGHQVSHSITLSLVS